MGLLVELTMPLAVADVFVSWFGPRNRLGSVRVGWPKNQQGQNFQSLKVAQMAHFK